MSKANTSKHKSSDPYVTNLNRDDPRNKPSPETSMFLNSGQPPKQRSSRDPGPSRNRPSSDTSMFLQAGQPPKQKSSRDPGPTQDKPSPKASTFLQAKQPARQKSSRDSGNLTRLQRDAPSTSGNSKAPSSNLTTKEDFDKIMASRQTEINKMSEEEKKKQDEWARSYLEETMTGACSRGFTFIRVKSGYVCAGAGHYIPHELVAEKKGRFYTMITPYPFTKFLVQGPFYNDKEAHDMQNKGHRSVLDKTDYADVWQAWNDIRMGRYKKDGKEHKHDSDRRR